MNDYVPPFPERPTTRRPLLETLRRLRRNLLEVWHERQFESDFFATRLLARRIFICNSPDTVHSAFVENAAAFERKTPQMRHALEPLVGDGLIISDGLVWKERRRVVAATTHVSRIGALAPVMTEAAAERRAAWEARDPDAPLDMLAEMGGLAAEVICRSVFGRRLGDDAAGQIVRAFARYQAKIGTSDLPSLLGLPEWFPRVQRLRVGAEVRVIHDVLDRLIAAVLDSGSDDPCLIRAMAAAQLAGRAEPMSRQAFRNEAATLFLAGHETTANTMAWAWFLLSQAPWALARVQAEADAVLAGRPATIADLDRLTYTRAVVEETLRLYPPIPLLAREAQRPAEIAGRPVPRGAIVMVVPWLLHRHRRYWERPDNFQPERFLPDAPPRTRHAYIPFSLGPRVCTGANFALAEAVICLATLAARFSPELVAGTQVMPVCRLTLRPGERLPMLLRRR